MIATANIPDYVSGSLTRIANLVATEQNIQVIFRNVGDDVVYDRKAGHVVVPPCLLNTLTLLEIQARVAFAVGGPVGSMLFLGDQSSFDQMNASVLGKAGDMVRKALDLLR